MKKHWTNESGASLLLALMTLIVLTLLATAIATVAFSNLKLSNNDREYQSTYYIAEAGVNQTYAQINPMVSSVYNDTSSKEGFFNF